MINNNWTKTSADDYPSGHRVGSLNLKFPTLLAALGEPMRSTDEYYPDDDHKTDVCWGFRNSETGAEIGIWNYKNGPNYAGDEVPTVEEINGFSVWAQPVSALEEFKAAFNLPDTDDF